jgi:hypothetical protein
VADPRFDLLLLGRKVCADREQAERLWAFYSNDNEDLGLGLLQPWLQLGTILLILWLHIKNPYVRIH